MTASACVGTPAGTRLAYLLLAFTTLFWAGNAVVGRALHAEIGPVTLAFWRWTLASFLVLPFAWRHLRGDWAVLRRGWPLLLALSVLGISAFNSLLYYAAHSTTATNIALVQTIMPAVIVLLSLLFFGDRVSLRGALGVGLSIAGGVVVVTRGTPAALADWRLVTGDLLMLVAVFLYALYSVLLRRRPAVHPLSFLAATFIIGALFLAPLYIWEWSVLGGPAVTERTVGGIAYVAVFPSILSYLFWNRGVELVGANRAGFFICLIPLYTAALAALLLGERLQPYHAIGLVLVVGGFLLFHRNETLADD